MKNSLTKKLLSVILAVTMVFGALPVLTVPTFAANESDLTFELNWDEDGYVVSDCDTSASGELVIPSEYNGLPVTEIVGGAFEDCTSLESVTIPDSVTSIGSYAFKDCTSLESITIPDSVTEIGRNAFSGCTSLNSVYITDIAAWCNIDFDWYDSSPLWYAENLYINSELATDIIVPDGVTSIGSFTFAGYKTLTSVTIPDSVTSIGRYAFYKCTSLTSITIPDSVKYINDDTFGYCTSLTSVAIGDSVTSIGKDAFFYCTSLTSVTIPNSVTSIGSSAFNYCTNLETITLGNGITTIGDGAFSDTAYYNDSENWENEVLYIGKYLIRANSENLSGEYKIKDGTGAVAESAFSYCKSLTSVTIPDSVTRIGGFAFYKCTSLVSATIYGHDTYIYEGWGSASSFTECNSELVINGYTHSTAHEYAINKNIAFNSIGDNDPLRYELNEEGTGYIVVGYEGAVCGELVIPAEYNGLPVVAIDIGWWYLGDHGVFSDCDTMTSVILPDSLVKIGSYAFRRCENLVSVTIGNGVTSIGEGAFEICQSLTSVTIGDSVTSIGSWAFDNCTSLESITIPDSVRSIGKSAFNWCGLEAVYITDLAAWCNIKFSNSYSNPLYYAENLYINGELATDIVIPDSVTNIFAYAFNGCTSLKSVTIPDGVTNIGSSAFDGCTSLTSVTIPDSVTNIGSSAFDGCTSLTSVTIPDSVTSIGSWAFRDCTSLESITLSDSLRYIGSSAFSGCASLTSLTIPDSVTEIGGWAFSDCTSLEGIYVDENNTEYSSDSNGVLFNKDKTELILYPVGNKTKEYSLPNSVTEICSSTFEGCTNLTSVTIPDSVTEIGGYAFSGCTSLTSVTIPDSVTEIGYYGFSGCTSLISVIIPDSVTSIGSSAFENCTSLTSVTIPNSVTSIGSSAFNYCTNLETITLGNGITTIGNGAFSNTAYYNDSENWENGVLYIGKYLIEASWELSGEYKIKDGTIFVAENAFEHCTSLTTITIPDSVTSIGEKAFYECTSLESINVAEGNNKYLSVDGVLFNKDKTELVCYPSNNNAENYSIPKSVTSIGDYAFYCCTKLTAVTIPKSVTSIGEDAFRGCTSLTSVTIPNSVTSIGGYAFGFEMINEYSIDRIYGFVIYGCEGSAAEKYANEYIITFAAIKLEDKDTGIYVEGAIDVDIELTVKKLTAEANKVVFDITLTKDGEVVQPDGKVTVKIPVPAGLDGANCSVYRKEENGTYTDMKAVFDGTNLIFTTDHFSEYVVTTENLGFIYGDVNGDGQLTPSDVVLLRRYFANYDSETETSTIEVSAGADVNGDGKLTPSDVVLLRRYFANYDSETETSTIILGK